jgi:flagellar basal body-associated protein FliL
MTKKGSAKKSIRNERKQKKAKNRRIKFQILLTIVVVLMGGAGWYFYWESTLPG